MYSVVMVCTVIRPGRVAIFLNTQRICYLHRVIQKNQRKILFSKLQQNEGFARDLCCIRFGILALP